MRNNRRSIWKNFDWLSLGFFLLLVLLGWGNIYAAVFNEAHDSIFDLSQRYGKQLLWILTALVLVFLVLLIDARVYFSLAYPLFAFAVLSLILVLVFGKEIAGARSWFVIGGFSIQPSEFAKMATALALARYLSTKGVQMERIGHQLRALLIVIVPPLLVIPQPDPGSALVYCALLLVMHREGLPGYYLFTVFGLAGLFLLSLLFSPLYLSGAILILAIIAYLLLRHQRGIFWRLGLFALLSIGLVQSVDYAFYNLLEDRHRDRINILLGKMDDPQGVGYNTHQSMIAIGSGGWQGKGYLQGTQTKYDFVPEQSTDFIFCTVGEEWGFWGSSLLVLIFAFFFLRLLWLAERQRSQFARAYGYGVVAILFFHFAVNIAMTIGLAPVIGIPLPFFSYGGSSLWGFTLLLFVFLRMDAERFEML